MSYPELYDAGHEDFTISGRSMIDACDIIVKQCINAAWSVSFSVPRVGKRWRYVRRGAIVKVDSQLYIVKSVSNGTVSGKPYRRAEGTHIFWERCDKKHIPTAFWIGWDVRSILSAAFAGTRYRSNTFRLLTDAEIYALDMEPVEARTDIEMDKINPLEVLTKVISNIGGEVYADNFTFALVKQLGRDTAVQFRLDKNIMDISSTDEDTKLVTRLYPYGKDGLEVASVNGGAAYIDSPLINDYPEINEGYMDFGDCETPSALWYRAWWEFSPENYNRIDRPKLTYRCGVIDLWKLAGDHARERLNLGDYALIYDKELEINARVRVVEQDYYPYEPQHSAITLGDPPRTIFNMLADMCNIGEYFYQPQTAPTADIGNITDVVFNKVEEKIEQTVEEKVEIINNDVINNFVQTNVLVAGTAHMLNAWIRELNVEFLETNFDALDPRCPVPPDNLRHFIRISGIVIQHIEAEIDPTALTNYVNKAGKQIYWTEIGDHPMGYEYFTLADPVELHAAELTTAGLDGTSGAEQSAVEIPAGDQQEPSEEQKEALREKYRVKVRQTISERVKKSDSFETLTLWDGSETVVPMEIWGAGDENGNGRGLTYKGIDGMYVTYTTRTGTGNTPAGTEIGYRVVDGGPEYYDVNAGQWRKPGAGGDGNIAIFDHEPTFAEFQPYSENTRIYVFFPNEGRKMFGESAYDGAKSEGYEGTATELYRDIAQIGNVKSVLSSMVGE